MQMVLTDKVAVVYGGGGAMGGAVARGLADAGALVVVAGRSLAKLEAVGAAIAAAGGRATVAQVDVDDTAAVAAHMDSVVADEGRVDICFNAAGMDAVQDVALADMTVDDFLAPITTSARRQFNTATAAARHMTTQGSGVIVTFSSTAAREWRHMMGGFSVACAGVEALTRGLAGELGPRGVRVVCVRPNFTPQTIPAPLDQLPPEVTSGIERLAADTVLGRLPQLAEVAGAVVFAASDAAGAMSGTVLNLSCGAIVD
jgi:NAD(P)-dependent dehydrogenase (short-subunit alcohol dehydrogenase family)